jgi:HK97 family phage major capsid protein
VNDTLRGFENEVNEEGKEELRNGNFNPVGNIFIPSKYLGKNFNIPNEKRNVDLTSPNVPDFVSLMNETSVLTRLGAKVIPSIVAGFLQGVELPTPGTCVSQWENEEPVVDTLNVTKMAPANALRLMSEVQFSSTLLHLGGSEVIEKFIVEEVVRSMNTALERASIMATINGKASGILNNAGVGVVSLADNGRAITQADLLNLIKEVSVNSLEMGSAGFLSNPLVRDYLKKTSIDAGSGDMIWDFNSPLLAGYNAGITNAVPSTLEKGTSGETLSACIFGNFQDLLLLQFSGIDILMDQYTSAKNSCVSLYITSFWNAQVSRPLSFAAIKDIKI